MEERHSERGEENERAGVGRTGQEIIAWDDVARNVRCLKASLPATPPPNLDATQPQRKEGADMIVIRSVSLIRMNKLKSSRGIMQACYPPYFSHQVFEVGCKH